MYTDAYELKFNGTTGVLFHAKCDCPLGMLTDSSESLFAYNNPGESFENFMDMGFEPVFAPEFEDEELERRAGEICGDDQFCLFDIAATGTLDIGMATMSGVRDFDMIVDLAEPSKLYLIQQHFD